MDGILQSKRNARVDVMKAILIILMVIGHSTSPWTTYIYLFHMPAFFVLSGFTYSGGDVGRYLGRKFFTILVPALVINFIFIIFYSLMQTIGIYEVISSEEPIKFEERVRGLFLYWATPDFGGATWFLLVLFWIECIAIIMEFILRKIGRESLFCATLLMIGIGGYLLIVYAFPLPYYLDLAMLGCFYYGCGILFQRLNLLSCIDYRVMLPFSICSIIFFGKFYFYGDVSMNWPTRYFTNLFIQLWSCFASIYVVWYVAGFINSFKMDSIFLWIGRHTYCILITHFAVFRCLFGIGACIGKVSSVQLQHLVPDAEIAYNGGWLVIAFATLLLCSVIAKLAERNRWTNYIFNARVPFKI